MECSKCRHENRKEAIFCLKCGEKLHHACPYCGHILPTEAVFCDHCGKKYDASIENNRKMIIKERCKNLTLKEARNQFEKAYIEPILIEFKWNITKASKVLGIERSNLHKKLKAYGLKPPQP